MNPSQHSQLAEHDSRWPHEWFRLAFSNIGDGVIATDIEGRITYLNPIAQSLTGWAEDEAEGVLLSEVFKILDEETRQPVADPVANALRENSVVGLPEHTLLIRKNGQEISIGDSAAPLRNAAGETMGVVLTFRDVTAQRQAEIVVREARQYAENIVATVRHPLVILDGHLRVQTANRSFYRTFQVVPEDIEQRLIYELGNGQWDIPDLRRLLTEILPQNTSFDNFEAEHNFPSIGHRFMMLNACRMKREGKGEGELILLAIEDVTAQRQAEQERREIETRFTSLVKNIKDHSIFTLDPAGHITSWNREAQKILGYSEQEILGQHFALIFTAEDVEQGVPQQELNAAQEVGRAEDERWHQRKNGELFWALGIVTPTTDDEGTHTGFSKILRDMTDRKRAEEELENVRSRLELTLTAGEVGTWDWDVVNDRVVADRNLAAMFGVSPEDPASQGLQVFLQAIHPDDVARVQDTIQKALDTGCRYQAEYRLTGSHEKVRWVIARGQVERDRTGRAMRLPGVAIDVTERIQAEQELFRLTAEAERQRRVYETALSNTKDFNYVFDLEGRFTYVNRALLALWHKSLWEAVGKTFLELDYPPELAARHQEQIRQVIETKQSLKEEAPYTSAEGERHYEYIFVPVIGAQGDVEAVAGSARDITERKELENSLRQLAADRLEADRRKTEFLATLGHELRNPLAPIRTGLELMKLVSNDPAQMEKTRRVMEVQVQQMVRLIDDLLDVSRITQGKLTLKKNRVALAEVIQNAIEASRPFLNEAGHHWTVTLPSQPIYLEADPNRLAQIVSNLLNNSAKYTPEKGHIWLSAERGTSDVLIKVRDNGIGIPAEMQGRIFEMFHQLDHPLEQGHKGLGIGLTLVQRLVEMHGGTIEVSSPGLNQGSEFCVRLPIAFESSLHTPPANPEEVAVRASGLRVMVVDDNRAAAEMLSMVVETLGNEVRTASDGQQATEIAAEFLPDVVLMDIGMPKMNGYEAARHIRQQPWGKKMMLVALTGWGQDQDKQRTKDAGFNHHLVKPAEASELRRLLAMSERTFPSTK